MINDIELVVIGAGPAGLEAALAASESGVEVVLIDSAPRPGGQYYQQIPTDFSCTDQAEPWAKEQQLIKRLEESNVHMLPETLVWGIFAGKKPGTWLLTLHGPGAPNRLNARAVIIASGAYDQSIPFPGWDLPGVVTAGAVLRMLKNQWLLPGERFVLAGTGPLQLQTAAYLVEAGAEVVAVCESTTGLFWRGIPYLPSIWGQWGRLKEGAGYINTLIQSRVPYRLGWTITAAAGEDHVSQVSLQKLGSQGQPISEPETIENIDSVVVGFGLRPQTALYRLLGCELEYQAHKGGYVPMRNETMATSLPGIYAVGDGAGISGAENARIEGRIAGYAIAADMGHLPQKTADSRINRSKPALRREQRFGRMLGNLFSPSPGMYNLADEDTIICRCEQVTLGEIREAIAFGAQSINDVKNIARTGMGNCQGRTCGNIIAHILASETGKTVAESHYLGIRPPIHPIPLHVVEEYDDANNQSDPGEKSE